MNAKDRFKRETAGGERSARQPKRNRRALIEATLDSIAEDGITDTTVSRIIERAGLSRGMIHLHFGGKNNLMAAAAEAFSDEYYEEMDRQIAGKDDDPAALVMAIVRTDLGEVILNERSARIWHAFRGAASTNAGIAQYSSTRDKRLRATIRDAFEEIAVAEGKDDGAVLARDATYGTLALLEGMWTDYLMYEDDFSRCAAVRIVCRFLAGLFPLHFRPEGSSG